MNHASLFSGIGACELAAEWMGWDNIFHCEINPFGQQVLNYYWPESKSYHDIKKTDFTPHRGTVDILSGGFPCQPFSTAGKRKGTADNRNLWPEMLRAIREIQPRWIVGENVRGLLNWSKGLVFDQVQTDLETAGYEVLPFLLPACAVNAPHRRDRIWFIAHTANYSGINGIGNDRHNTQAIPEKRFNECISTPNPNSDGQLSGNREHEKFTSERGFDALNDIEQVSITDTSNTGLQGYELRQAFEQGERREQTPRQVAEFYQANDWGSFPTQSPVCGRNDGLPAGMVGITVSKHRKESLMAYGNSMVPQVVHQIFKAIEAYEINSK